MLSTSPAESETTAGRRWIRCDRLFSAAPASTKARNTGTGSHATTRQPSFAAYSA